MDMVIKEHSAVLKLTTLTPFQAAGWMEEGNYEWSIASDIARSENQLMWCNSLNADLENQQSST